MGFATTVIVIFETYLMIMKNNYEEIVNVAVGGIFLVRDGITSSCSPAKHLPVVCLGLHPSHTFTSGRKPRDSILYLLTGQMLG